MARVADSGDGVRTLSHSFELLDTLGNQSLLQKLWGFGDSSL